LRGSGLVVAALATAALVAPVEAADDNPRPEDSGYVLEATVTGYAAGADGGSVGALTATGTETHWGTVAADWSVFPPGTRLRIDAFDDMVFVVEDRGGAVRGTIIDVWFPDAESARAFGTQKRMVTVLPP
jgi:3D (Asp-Asp-Asp) domain-containing protein